MPTSGDTVIGVIVDIGPSNWLVDIGAPYPAPLHVNEVPWKVEFGDTSKYLTVGNVVLLKVLSVDESKKIQVTMKDSGLRRIEGGRLVKINHSKVSRVIGKSGSMIQLLKAASGCRIFVGQNGRIWIDGEEDRAAVVADAIKMIEEKAQARDLTEKVKVYLESKLPAEEE
jgi:exosome complex component RRP4